MTPSFALLLDPDGISLLHRSGASWHSLGAVSLDTPDLGDALANLRANAEALGDGAPLRCALVLPNSQILYTEAEAGRDAKENATRAARRLDGATPYLLDELVFDWRARGEEIWIAAVARETLEEAEGFAALHGFGPICFTATPEPGAFPGAPFFGPTDAAPRLLASGEVLERLNRPIIAAPPQEPLEEPAAQIAADTPDKAEGPEPEAPASEARAPVQEPEAPEPVSTEVSETEGPETDAVETEPVEAEPLSTEDAPSDPAEDAKATPIAPPDKTEQELRPEPEAEETLADPVEFRRTDLDAPLPETPPELSAPAALDPLETEEEDEGEPASKPHHAPVIFRRADLDPVEPEETDPAPPVPEPDAGDAPEMSEDGGEAPPAVAFASIRPSVDPEPASIAVPELETESSTMPPAPEQQSSPAKAPTSAKSRRKGSRKRKEPPVAAPPPSSPATTEAQEAPAPATLSAALFAADAAMSATPAPGNAPSQSTTSAPSGLQREAAGLFAPERQQALSEAEALTVFGARKSQKQPGGSISAGLIAAVAGIAAIGLVTLWAFVGRSPGEAGIAGLTPPEGLIIEAPRAPNVATPEAIAIAPTRSDPEQQAVVSAESQPESSAPEAVAGALGTKALVTEEVALATDDNAETGSAAADYGAEMQLAALPTAESTGQDETGQPAARLEAEGAPQVATDPGSADAVAPPPAPLDAISARAAYAVSGIWQRAPERGYLPTQDGLEDFYIASIDPKISNHDAFSLPRLDLRPDEQPPVAEIPVVPVPQAADTDAQTASIPPGGVEIRLGRPDIVPPRRPEGLAPQEPTSADSAETTSAVDERLRDARPRQRPQGLIEDNERAVLGGRTRSELGRLRPVSRPASVQETALALSDAARMADAETPAEQSDETVADRSALEADLATATKRAVARSPEPRLRPANIAQIADRARQRAIREAVVVAEAEQKARAAAEQAALAKSRADASAARKAALAAAAAEKQQKEAAARATKEAEAAAKAEAKAASARGPAVPRNERVRPKTTTPATVARKATEKNALRLSRVSLIGVYGTSSQRRALVRLPSGKYVKVKVGDRIDGGRVAAIGQSDLRYNKSGRTVTLKMPKG
ncbi:hypothetical protein R3X27_08885 [Tropicimonas sp. TH_r6]|uniref:hypothetical protein n=1 Tax=Tropicimonas sp. TH_r6 TaxID=3082085 RepID=UPI0029537644|nr:hypothetical protein [Tropicimonas sp. TH_r6]MDV7142797.1 hypothetical protein [Tropicimonas sp. TH_r6]